MTRREKVWLILAIGLELLGMLAMAYLVLVGLYVLVRAA